MQISSAIININSEHADALASFYRDVVGLPQQGEMGPNALDAGGTAIVFDTHSEVTGKTKEPPRVLLNMMVEDLAAEENRLVAAGVPCTRSQGVEFWGGVISTFLDPDGNFFQLMQYRPDLATHAEG